MLFISLLLLPVAKYWPTHPSPTPTSTAPTPTWQHAPTFPVGCLHCYKFSRPPAQLINKFQRRQNKTFFIGLRPKFEEQTKPTPTPSVRATLPAYALGIFHKFQRCPKLNRCPDICRPLDWRLGSYFSSIFTLEPATALLQGSGACRGGGGRRMWGFSHKTRWLLSAAVCHLVGASPIFQQLHAPTTNSTLVVVISPLFSAVFYLLCLCLVCLCLFLLRPSWLDSADPLNNSSPNFLF